MPNNVFLIFLCCGSLEKDRNNSGCSLRSKKKKNLYAMILTFVKQNPYCHRTWLLFYLKTFSNLICKVFIAGSLSTLWPFLTRKFWSKENQRSIEEHCHLCVFFKCGQLTCVYLKSQTDNRVQTTVKSMYRMYTYGWFMLMYGRSQHNIVKQLSFNKNIFF